MTTVPGRDNTVGMPIYLLPLDDRGLDISEDEGGTLTLPELPGFSLEVAPGSVTFPDGTREGVVSATLVRGDRVPMVPGFGQQPRFIVTIQPAGAIFDPPARLSLPNVDALAPGAVTELYSFDHDLGAFVGIGPATVTEDGTAVVSNPGVGILKAGWHCGGNPTTSGTPHDCPPCQICNGSTCVPGCSTPGNARRGVFPATPDFLAGLSSLGCECPEEDPCEFDYRCDGNGGCISTPVKVTGITGPCIAAVGQSRTYTAQANKPSKAMWRSTGSPAEGEGATFTVSFGSEGGNAVAAGCGGQETVKVVGVVKLCSSLPTAEAITTETEVDPPEGYFGIVRLKEDPETVGEACIESDRWCFRLTEFRQKLEFGVGSDNIDVKDPTDSSIVNPQTCAQIILDLSPPAIGSAVGPPRSQYWSSAITTVHERFHVTDMIEKIVQPLMLAAEAYLAEQDCTACVEAFSKADQLKSFIREYAKGLVADFERNDEDEIRAYDDSRHLYIDLINQIKAQSTPGWPAICRP